MALFGADKCNFFKQRVTIQKVLQLCSKGTLPIAIDDPDSVKDVNRLIIDLYNGAQGGTKGSGVQTPTAGAVISANITATDRERCMSCHVRKKGVSRKIFDLCLGGMLIELITYIKGVVSINVIMSWG